MKIISLAEFASISVNRVQSEALKELYFSSRAIKYEKVNDKAS